VTGYESALDLSYARDAKKSVADDQLVDKTNVTDPDCWAKVETTEPTKTVVCEPRRSEHQLWEMIVPGGVQARHHPNEISCLRKSVLPSSKLFSQVCRISTGIR